MREVDRRLFLRYMAASGLSVPFWLGCPGVGLARARGAGGAADAGLAEDAGADASALAKVFANPPQSAGPGAYWYWLGGNVTREGITADLEAMRDAGIWTPMLFAIGKSAPRRDAGQPEPTIGNPEKRRGRDTGQPERGGGNPDKRQGRDAGQTDSSIHPAADALTPLWWELVEHAASEAERLGLVLSLNCCDGWATASGPWITPELSMQHVVWSQQTVEGGKRFDGIATKPPTKMDYYRDIATVAVPHPIEWDETSFSRRARVTTNLPPKVADLALLLDPGNGVEVFETEQAGWIDYSFDAPFTLRSVRVHTPSPPGYSPGVYRAANSLEVQASDDGKTFRRIGALEYPRHGWQTDLTTLTHAVPQTTARYFRLVHREIPTRPYEEEYDFGQDVRLRVFSIVLSSEPRIHHLQGKSAEQWAISRRTTAEDVPDSACVHLKDIVDLTHKLDAGGRLTWDAPPGRWRVLRIGYTTTGAKNSAAGGAEGLECDRFSAAATRLQFDNWFGLALRKVGPRLAGQVLHVLHVDSWEAGSQNWSPEFAARFHELRGYDLLPYIATMTGVPVESADVSERVLLDVRRTVNDLMQSEFFQAMAALAHQHSCLMSAEPPNPTFPADGMEHLAHVDWPMGEFWLNTPRNDKPTDIKDAVSGSRLYGKKVAAAESFTEGLMSWDEHPFTLKALGDRIYCEGINRFMLHVYAQQPWLDRAPGMTLNGIGTFFSRTQTWWRPGKAWFDYLRRCQALLQEGVAVADVCYFTGENIPARTLLPRQLSVAVPKGYSYDCINRDGLLRWVDVHDGWIGVKDAEGRPGVGGRYRVLVLPDDVLMTPEIASRLRELVRAGAVVIGPRPLRSPSLMGFPAADETVSAVARELWGERSLTVSVDRRVGAGRVVWGVALEKVLQETGLPPDVEIKVVDPTRVLPAATDRAGGAHLEGTAGGANLEGTARGANPEGAAGGAHLGGTAGGADLEGTARGANPEGTAGSADPQGTAGGAHLEGAAGGADLEGAAGGADLKGTARDADILWTHRAGPGWDLYFLSNQSNTTRKVAATFRVAGRQPELWRADTGEVERLAMWREATGRTTVELSFDPAGSLFVLFSRAASEGSVIASVSGSDADAVRLRERNGRVEATVSRPGSWTLVDVRGAARKLKVAELPKPLVLAGPWQVRFTERVDRPIELTLSALTSWTDRPEPDVKYYSGTGSYTTAFILPAAPNGHRVLLDLGEVHDLAEVKVNEQSIAIVWKPPFTLDITRAVRAGHNKLDLAVTNTWRNRLIGDFGKQDAQRKTFVVPSLRLGKPWLPGGPGTVLSPAGLLGPVRVRYEAVVNVG